MIRGTEYLVKAFLTVWALQRHVLTAILTINFAVPPVGFQRPVIALGTTNFLHHGSLQVLQDLRPRRKADRLVVYKHIGVRLDVRDFVVRNPEVPKPILDWLEPIPIRVDDQRVTLTF